MKTFVKTENKLHTPKLVYSRNPNLTPPPPPLYHPVFTETLTYTFTCLIHDWLHVGPLCKPMKRV